MKKFHTTFAACAEAGACKSGLRKMRKHLGEDYGRDVETSLVDILPELGVSDTLWILGNVNPDKDTMKVIVDFAQGCADRVKKYDARWAADDAAADAAAAERKKQVEHLKELMTTE